jgi:hypothetical protein
MVLLILMKSILTPARRRCNHGSGIFGTASKQLSEGARSSLEEARSDLRRCKIPTRRGWRREGTGEEKDWGRKGC